MSSEEGGSRLGTRFGPYELRSLIGVGGMGEVYRAYDTERDRLVAIKLLRPELAADPNFRERFRRESRVAARLSEPHVIPVHDFGEIDGVLYIDMRLVDGASLKAVLANEGALEPARAVSIIRQVASALDAAHANGLVHRDIKPENVLLTRDDFAYVVDFGIAQGGGDASVTSTGLVVGSSAYMAPERFSGERGGPASDVYSLTCLLYETLTGRAPFDGADVRQVMSAHMFYPPPRPSIMRRGINRAFDEVVARGMAKQPRDRYRTAGELAEAAAAAAEQPSASSTAPEPVPTAAHPAPTRQFTTMYPDPAGTGYLPYPPAALEPSPDRPKRAARVGPSRVGLIATTAVMSVVAAVLAGILVVTSGDDTTAGRARLAAPPPGPEPTVTTSTPPVTTTAPTSTDTTTRSSAPTTTTWSSTSPPTTTTSSTATGPPTTDSGGSIAGVSGTDAQGFVGHTARCNAGSTPAAVIRTPQSIAVVCETGSGDYYYRGERLRDGANLELSDVRRQGNGFVAVNPADGARYEVRPDRLTIESNGKVDSAEPALEYGPARR